MNKWYRKRNRRIAYLVALLVILVAFKVGGVFIDLFLVVCWAVPVFGMGIYKKGHRYIAKTNADAMVAAQQEHEDAKVRNLHIRKEDK